jgi:DNA-binding transcriptional LysR family regulator
MSIVLAVAEAGSLAAAVRRLNTPPATASRKISELENIFAPSSSIDRRDGWC